MAAQGRLILLCGLPGAGKTTAGEKLTRTVAALRFSPDEWMAALGFPLRDGQAREKIEELQWNIARDVLRLGQTVVLENGFWSRTERDRYRVEARNLGAAVELRFFDVPFQELVERLARRPVARRVSPEELRSWLALFERPDARELALYDSAQSDDTKNVSRLT
jgi:predicted kinase